MGRAPCCEKMGLKKGPWTPEEDRILTSYVQLHGHPNWRALPKQAGLLRCGKSCRLRWVNYLKPDIRRGNFTPEEEEAIIQLHEMLGNRWSAIAARLPGRTDNEIKNVWHTHLKKRLNNNQTSPEKPSKKKTTKSTNEEHNNQMVSYLQEESPQQSNVTTTTTTTINEISSMLTETSSDQSFPMIDESFWSENLTVDDFEVISTIDIAGQSKECGIDQGFGGGEGEMGFWYDVFVSAGGLPELPEF